MSSAGKMRIGIEGARELEIDVDDLETAATDLEKAVGTDTVVWIADTKGDRHGIVGTRVAFIEVEEASDRSVGFGL
ncbi:MAG: DUF3107 family protein [Acidimicrobiia bacterium]|nr:DUF3107 family protein [Acidimicrobiia bacterium]